MIAPAALQSRHHHRVGLGDVVAQRRDAVRAGRAGQVVGFLHRHRQAVQRPPQVALGQRRIGLARARCARRTVHPDDGVDRCGCSRSTRARKWSSSSKTAELAGADQRRQPRGRLMVQCVSSGPRVSAACPACAALSKLLGRMHVALARESRHALGEWRHRLRAWPCGGGRASATRDAPQPAAPARNAAHGGPPTSAGDRAASCAPAAPHTPPDPHRQRSVRASRRPALRPDCATCALRLTTSPGRATWHRPVRPPAARRLPVRCGFRLPRHSACRPHCLATCSAPPA